MRVVYRIILVIIACLALAAGGLFVWFYTGIGLPKLSALKEYRAAQNTKIFSANGRLLTELHGEENREIISIEQIPKAMRDAVIAIEDSDFYHHSGINWKAVIRALWANIIKGSVVQGGSTIPQQYVKNAYVGTKRTLFRKIQEAHLAYQLSKKYSKNKILELYLNDIYFGQGCYGIYTAARKYFNKDPRDLGLSECAMLAGLINSPSYYDPYQRPQAVIERRNHVLKRMHRLGYISARELQSAQNEPLNVSQVVSTYTPPPAPYFCDYITKLLRRTYGDQKVYRGGLRVYTTIDLNIQEIAERTLLKYLKPESGPDAAIVAIDPRTGYIKAMVGGKNYYKSQFNVAAEGGRQAGSAFKVFVLTRAMADGISPETTYDASSPKIIRLPDGGKWVVRNYDGHGSGSMTIRTATIRSVNVVFAQLIMDVGPSRVADLAMKMGILREVESNPAIALGGLKNGVTPLDMASAYSTLANNGVHAIPRSIYKVTDADGNVIDEYQPETSTIIDTKVAARVNQILKQVVSSGTGRGAQIGRPQAGKTGTTEDHADAWFVGYTPDLVAAVWVGYPQGRIPMPGMCGGDLPATLWRVFVSQALKDVPPTDFPLPSEEVATSSPQETENETITVRICEDSGLLATPYCPKTRSKEFKRGEEPTTFCHIHTGVAETKVPDVVGMTEAQARVALSQAGYTTLVVKKPSQSVPAGLVMSQTPSAGTRYTPGNPVTIIVSSGTIEVVVPNVVGLTEAAAKAKITVKGLKPSISYVSGSPAGFVLSQSPGAGTVVGIGTTVELLVAR